MNENKPHTFRDYFPNIKKHFRFTSIPIGDYFITTGDDVTEFIEEQKSIQNENKDLQRLIQRRTALLKDTEDEIRILRGIIPIYSYCHCIRNDEGAWDKLEAYISKHSEAQFSHGICPKCFPKVLAEAKSDSK